MFKPGSLFLRARILKQECCVQLHSGYENVQLALILTYVLKINYEVATQLQVLKVYDRVLTLYFGFDFIVLGVFMMLLPVFL